MKIVFVILKNCFYIFAVFVNSKSNFPSYSVHRTEFRYETLIPFFRLSEKRVSTYCESPNAVLLLQAAIRTMIAAILFTVNKFNAVL